jgi:hypothetical protein
VSRFALRGRVVTMDAAFTTLDDGVVYVDGNLIAAVSPHDAPAPQGFAGVTPVDVGGTLFPGLIELHNHLAYNVIGLWLVDRNGVDKRYSNRDQWPRNASYQTNLTGPMKVLSSIPSHVAAITRYVECKALFGGVTATQGITLSSNAGIRKFFIGLVRNVEETLDPELPDAKAKIGDVASKDAKAFRAALLKAKCYLLHLSEGTDAAAHQHFEALTSADPDAIEASLAGIHCVALKAADFKAMAQHKASMVWSPLSNLLLYGETADVKAARNAGVPIGLGPDWAYSGSKNLLGELKVARAVNALQKLGFSDRDLVRMATIDAARILRWDQHLGSIEAGKRADVIAVGGPSADPLEVLFKADESDIRLSVIDGNPRFGTTALMTKLGAAGESIKVGGAARVLSFTNDQPGAPSISLTDATQILSTSLKNMPALAKEAAKPKPAISALAAMDAPPQWRLALDEIEPSGVEIRPHLPVEGHFTGMTVMSAPLALAAALPAVIKPLRLDPVTFVDDPEYIDTIALEPNLGDDLKTALYAAYGRKPTAKPKGKKQPKPAAQPNV